MKRTLNWTGRQSIPIEKVAIRVNILGDGQPPSFSAELAGLSDLGLDPSGKVYVEPYVGSSSMRFEFGTVGTPKYPPDTALSEIDTGAGILFRIRVVDETANIGRILATAEAIRPQNETEDDDKKSLLPVAFRDLGEAIWQLDLQPGARPYLVLNNKIPALGELIRTDPIFQGAVIPHAVEQILRAIYLKEEFGDDESEWCNDWRQFVASLRGGDGINEEAEDDEIEAGVKDVLNRFVADMKWATLYRLNRERMDGVVPND